MTTTRTPSHVAARQLAAVNALVVEGLPSAYTSVEEWLADWWSDAPWTDPDRADTVRLLLADPDFPRLARLFRQQFVHDLTSELEQALID